jgi:hypothetical protein
MMDLYNGFFRRNATCGYILKPAIMREEIAYFSANTKDVIPGVSPQILHIKVGGSANTKDVHSRGFSSNTSHQGRGKCKHKRCHSRGVSSNTSHQGTEVAMYKSR